MLCYVSIMYNFAEHNRTQILTVVIMNRTPDTAKATFAHTTSAAWQQKKGFTPR